MIRSVDADPSTVFYRHDGILSLPTAPNNIRTAQIIIVIIKGHYIKLIVAVMKSI